MDLPLSGLRADKWLWAARIYKTRTQAAAALDGGHVRVNGHPAKPSRELRAGDRLDITIGSQHWRLIVVALNAQRRPASEARGLYAEDADSIARREAVRESLRLAPSPGSDAKGRPTKKARRQIHRFNVLEG